MPYTLQEVHMSMSFPRGLLGRSVVLVLGVALACLGNAALAAPKVLYMSASGSDTADGSSEKAAVGSLADAVERATARIPILSPRGREPQGPRKQAADRYLVPFMEYPLAKFHSQRFDLERLHLLFPGATLTLLAQSKTLPWVLVDWKKRSRKRVNLVRQLKPVTVARLQAPLPATGRATSVMRRVRYAQPARSADVRTWPWVARFRSGRRR